jgi:hypothetical protein
VLSQTCNFPNIFGFIHYIRILQELLAGVNISELTGNVTTCEQFAANGQCLKKHENSFILTDLSLDKLYGVVICGVLDPKNLSFPNILGNPQGIAPRAEKIFISSESRFFIANFDFTPIFQCTNQDLLLGSMPLSAVLCFASLWS